MDIPTEDMTGRWFKYKNDTIIYLIRLDPYIDGYECLVNSNLIPAFVYSYHWKDLEPYEC